MDIEKRVDELFQELVEIRRDFHMHPEVSENEYRTCDKICEYLTKWGIKHEKGIAETGIVAIVRGKKEGKTVGARADIDALPVTELNELPFKSINEGVMHAFRTQFPYALLVAGVSTILYIIAGLHENSLIILPGILVLFFLVYILHKYSSKKLEKPNSAMS